MRRLLTMLCVSAAAMFAVSAVTTAAAQAKAPKYWYEGAELNTELAIKSHSGESKLWVTSTLKTLIVCTADTDSGKIAQKTGEGGTNKEVRVTYTGCKLYEAKLNAAKTAWEEGSALSACSVSSEYFEGATKKETKLEEIKTSLLKSKLAYLPGTENTTEEVVDAFEPEISGQSFVTIVLGGASCAIKGSYPIGGSVVAKVTPIKMVVKSTTLTFGVTNDAAGVTQNPEEYELGGVKTRDTLTFGPTIPAAYESADTVELENGKNLEVRSS